MFRRKQLLLNLWAGVLCCGCGGGGGGSGDPFFAGVWTGALNLVEDTCGLIGFESQFVFFNHLVNQDQNQILIDNGATVFSGTVQTDTSFSASADRTIASPFTAGATCAEKITWRYEAIDEEANVADFVVRVSAISCARDSEITQCQSTFTGSGFRTRRVDIAQPRPIDSTPVFSEAPDQAATGGASVNEADL